MGKFYQMMMAQRGGGGGRLPDEYQEVEYLQSSGTQYIDVGIKNKTAMKVSAKVMFNTTPTSRQCLIGTYSSSGGIYQFVRDSSNVWSFRNYGWFNTSFSVVGGQEYELTFNGVDDVTKCSLSVGEDTYTASGTWGITATLNVFIFCINNEGTPSYYFNGRYYYCTFEDESGTLADLVPCYRKSDNVAGMYDLVSGNFLENKGSGTFVVGGKVN